MRLTIADNTLSAALDNGGSLSVGISTEPHEIAASLRTLAETIEANTAPAPVPQVDPGPTPVDGVTEDLRGEQFP